MAFVPPLVDLAYFTPSPADRCIYCGALDDLRSEHILPYGLGGPAEIPRASCGNCARITGAIEQEVLRGALWPLRVFLDLKSRTKHQDAPKTIQLTLALDGGRELVLEVPLEKAPIVFIFPIFTPPAVIDPTGYTGGIRVCGAATIGYDNGLKELLTAHGATSVAIKQNTRPITFARMLAKIAYAMAFAQGELQRLSGPAPIVPSILGQSDDVGRWVGTYGDPPTGHPGLLHHVVAREPHDHGVLAYEVQLFALSHAPRYSVVLGRLGDQSRPGAHGSAA